jgi:hypothetical protein
MADAGTKYLAISFCSLPASTPFGRTEIFWLMMPSRHLLPASNTPDPEFPVVATSLINVENFVRILAGSKCGDMIRERAVPSGIATMTGCPVHGDVSQSGMRRMRRLTGSLCSSMDSSVRSTPQCVEPSLIACAGRSTGDAHAWLGARSPANNVGGGDHKALSQIYAVASPRFRWMPDDVDRVDAQRVVRALGVRTCEWGQNHRRQAKPYRNAHG